MKTDRPVNVEVPSGLFSAGIPKTSGKSEISSRKNPSAIVPEQSDIPRTGLNDQLVTYLNAQGVYSSQHALMQAVLESTLCDFNKSLHAEGPLRLMYLEALENWFSQKKMQPEVPLDSAALLARVGEILLVEFKQCERWVSYYKESANQEEGG